jgi:hypothetical protein
MAQRTLHVSNPERSHHLSTTGYPIDHRIISTPNGGRALRLPRVTLEPFQKACFRLRRSTAQLHSVDLVPAERTSPRLRASTRMFWSFRGRASRWAGIPSGGRTGLGAGSTRKEGPRQVLGSPLSAIWRIDGNITCGDSPCAQRYGASTLPQTAGMTDRPCRLRWPISTPPKCGRSAL